MKKGLMVGVMALALAGSVAAGALAFASAQEPAALELAVAPAAVLRQGSSGGEVKEVQRRLKNWGYYSGAVDGIFGAATKKAVVRFQQKNGLTADGIVGKATYKALGMNDSYNALNGSGSSGSSGGVNGYTSSDVYLMAKAIYAEGRGESYTGQVAIGAVIMNRVKSPQFPNTIAGVIYQKGAFTAVDDGQINLEPNDTAYRATLYELVSVSEDMDDNFAKLRVSSGTGEQRTLLTQILVDAALMESAIEKIPVDAATGTDISSFVNRTGMSARRMLAGLSAGGTLDEREQKLIAYLYETNAKLCSELNDLALHTSAEELAAFFEGAENGVGGRFSEIGQGTAKRPEEIGDAPFAGEGNVGDNAIENATEISAADAEEKVRGYFEDYHIADVRMTGETAARDFRAYNFVLTDENGTEIFAQVTKKAGKLAFFDSYEVCTQKNFSLENCDSLAQEYLAGLGYTQLVPVWFSDAGNVASITYVADIGGVRAYTDMIRVRVCEEKGRVIGMDAHAYLVNHHGKREQRPTLTQAQARAKLSSVLEVRSAHMALIPFAGREVLTYEFVCDYKEEQYLLYLDAHSGEEVRIFRVHESAQGSYLS